MTTFITFTILGLVVGSVYAIAASGLVLTYTTSGIFNFAHGAQAMLGAFLFWQFKYGWGWPTWLALVVDLFVVGPAMGYLMYAGVMKGLRNTAEVTKIVVTVSLLLGFVYLSQWIWHADEPRTIEMFFGSGAKVNLFGVGSMRVHELIALVTAVAIAIGLRVLFHNTRLGVAMRGAVDDPDLLRLNGFPPERVAAISWAFGSMLAVLAGILITPISGGSLEANALTLLVIDAFAAALFGRLRSIPRTFLGAIVLGLVSTYIIAYFPPGQFTSNLRVSLPMIVLFVLLVMLPQDRLRGLAQRTRERVRIPTVRSAAIWGVVLVVVVYMISLLMVEQAISTLTLGMCFAIIALSLTLLTGYAGEMNLAAVSFGAVGMVVAYHVGLKGTGLASYTSIWGVVAGVLIAALVGGLVALPALRMRGLYLALATMAFGVFLANMVLRDTGEHELFGKKFSLFPGGNLVVPPVKFGPVDLKDKAVALMVCTVLFALIGIGLVAIRNSGFGRRLTAMKDSPAAAAMLGQNLVGLKLVVFVLSAGIAGLGGILQAGTLGAVSADNYHITLSLALLMLCVVGGIGYVSGALVGGIMAGVGVSVLVVTFNNLAAGDTGGLDFLWTFIGHLVGVSPALIGIGVGKHPSGNVHRIVENWRPMRRFPALAVGVVAVLLVLWGLAFTKTISNWVFAISVALVLMYAPNIAGRLAARRDGKAADGPLPVELEGVSTAYTPQLRHRLDTELGLPEYARGVTGHGAA